ncbi:MAG: right-handed parallel beta-helix repeat-containing protein [Nitrososphaerales archaeon]
MVGDVVVEAGASLTIEPGVIVKFTSGTNLVIDGSLIALGNSTHKIIFTSNATTPNISDWGAIRIRNYGDISYSIIEYADIGTHFDETGSLKNSLIKSNNYGISIATADVLINNINVTENNVGIYSQGDMSWPPQYKTILKNSYIGLNGIGIYHRYGGLLTIINCTVSGNEDDGIRMEGGDADIYNTEISNNKGGGIRGGSSIIIHNSVISNNTNFEGVGGSTIEIYNSVITNNARGISGNSVTILKSNITNNIWYGVSGTNILNITHSEISGNGGTGIIIVAMDVGGRALIQYNNIRQNSGSGIYLGEDIKGNLLIHHNNIYENAKYDLEYNGLVDIDVTNNWWGTVNETLIEERIYDYYDNYYRGKVLYKPYLSTPVEISIPPSTPPANIFKLLAFYIGLALMISIVAIVALFRFKRRKKEL